MAKKNTKKTTTRKQNTYTEILENAHKLKAGESYTYKKLTEILETNYTSKDSKNAQLKVLDSIVEYVKMGTKYKIVAFRDTKVKVVDNRGKSIGSRNNNKGIFKEDLLTTLLYFCVSCAEENNLFTDDKKDDFIITKSRHDLMCEIGIRNKHNNYVAKVQPNNFCNELSIEKSTFEFVFNKINHNSHSAMKSMLDTLTKSKLAIKTDTMKVIKYMKYFDEELNKFVYNEGLIIENRFATEEEYVQINHIKRDIATKMGFKDENQIHSSFDSDIKGEFYNRVREEMERKFDISLAFPMMKLHFKKSNIDSYLKKFNDISLDELLEIGNNIFLTQQQKTIKSSQTRYKNNLQKGVKPSNKLAYVQTFDNYLDKANVIAKYLIDMFAPPIQLLDKDLKLDHNTNTFIKEN